MQIKFDKLSVRDLDKAIADAEKGAKGDAPHFVVPSQYTSAALSGEWVQARLKLADKTFSASAKDMVAFPAADQNFRLATSAALLGQVLRGSPFVGKADLKLVKEMTAGLEGKAADTLKSWVSGAEQAK